MVDLKVYRNEKQFQGALEFIDAFVELRVVYEDVKKIAECESSKYTKEQKHEAVELTKNGFIDFVSIIMKIRH